MASKMASYVTGYEDERFEHVVSQSFHCIICTNVFKDPVMCHHNEHLFCRACITIHLTNSQTCPTCMEQLTVDTLTQAPRGIRNILSELKIRCEFFERGCGVFVELGDLERHVAVCGFAPAVCSNEGCQLEVNKQDLIHHETAVCELRRVQCHRCNEVREEIDTLKANLAQINETVNKNEKTLEKNEKTLEKNEKTLEKNEKTLDRNAKQLQAVEQNLVAKVELVQGQLNKQGENIRVVQGDILEMKKSLSEIMKQLVRMTQQPSHQVLVEQEELKKGIAEANVMESEPMVVVAGGMNDEYVALNSVEMFDLLTRTWTPLQPMRESRFGASSVVHNNQVFVGGGGVRSGDTKSMERFLTNAVHADLSVTWERLTAKLPGRLSGHCSVVYNGRLIVIGGYDSDKSAVSNSITEISLVSPHTTKLLATMALRRHCHGVAIFGDKIVILGGSESFSGLVALSSVIRYDITKNECQELAPLPYPVRAMATVKWDDDNLIIIGGVGSDRKPLNKVLMYNVKTRKSGMLPDMKYKRGGCVAAVVKDTVIVIGGMDESGTVLKSVESFRFDRYSWNELPEMRNKRYRATAVVC